MVGPSNVLKLVNKTFVIKQTFTYVTGVEVTVATWSRAKVATSGSISSCSNAITTQRKQEKSTSLMILRSFILAQIPLLNLITKDLVKSYRCFD